PRPSRPSIGANDGLPFLDPSLSAQICRRGVRREPPGLTGGRTYIRVSFVPKLGRDISRDETPRLRSNGRVAMVGFTIALMWVGLAVLGGSARSQSAAMSAAAKQHFDKGVQLYNV